MFSWWFLFNAYTLSLLQLWPQQTMEWPATSTPLQWSWQTHGHENAKQLTFCHWHPSALQLETCSLKLKPCKTGRNEMMTLKGTSLLHGALQKVLVSLPKAFTASCLSCSLGHIRIDFKASWILQQGWVTTCCQNDLALGMSIVHWNATATSVLAMHKHVLDLDGGIVANLFIQEVATKGFPLSQVTHIMLQDLVHFRFDFWSQHSATTGSGNESQQCLSNQCLSNLASEGLTFNMSDSVCFHNWKW